MSNFTNSLESLLSSALNGEITEQEYYAFSGSNLPYCARRAAYNILLRPDRLPTRQTPMAWSLAAEIGTAMHTVIQKALAQSGCLYGNWVCRCGQTRSLLLGPQVCSCGKNMSYDEIYVKDPHTPYRGKVDAVIKIGEEWALVDFKTKASAKKLEMDEKHLYQLASYKYFLELEPYNLKFDHVYIAYIQRAEKNPQLKLVNAGGLQGHLKKFEVDRYWATQVQTAIDNKEVTKLPKLCRQVGDESFCPFSSVCFSYKESEMIEDMYGKH